MSETRSTRETDIQIGLNVAIIAMAGKNPTVLTVRDGNSQTARESLPLGAFDPARHRTFEMALRAFVSDQTGLDIGYVEQLYTFGDRGRHTLGGATSPHTVSVGYLALTRLDMTEAVAGRQWIDWHAFFPWEDWRGGRPRLLDELILPKLADWAGTPQTTSRSARMPSKKSRLRLAFGLDDFPWDEERVLERYELLYEAGMVEEAVSDGRVSETGMPRLLGRPMRYDHRRILATAVSRLRGKFKYRPVIFELMPDRFTLTELQETVEAIAGHHLHKQNFRRLVDGAALVERTGESSARTGGRPAALYRFRHQIFEERPAPGLKVGRTL